jgi:hypothetical protein
VKVVREPFRLSENAKSVKTTDVSDIQNFRSDESQARLLVFSAFAENPSVPWPESN